MKTTKCATIVALFAAASAARTFAVVDQTLQIQGTNLVLSWPSRGYEYYMIEYRPTLDPATPWIQLTNNYPANSTNRTTYIVPCCTLNDLATNIGAFLGAGSSIAANSSRDSSDSEWWAVPADGSGDPAPLDLYPPGFPTNTLIIYQISRSSADSFSSSASNGESDGPQPDLASGGCNCPDIGFFRVWHIPDWLGDVTSYVFDGPTFIPVDFKDYRDNVANIEVLLDGQPIPDAVYTYLISQGITYWGMGIYFDLYASATHTLQLRTTLRLNEYVGDDSSFLVLTNLTRSISVDNEVTFTNWDDLIESTNFTFRAQTRTNNTDWQIDIYDAYNNYVNGGSGHTSDGQVSWTWDLTDTLGNPRDDIDSDPFFYSYMTFADSRGGGQTTRTTPAAQTAYPAAGYWFITYMDRYYLDVKPGTFVNVQGYYTNAMNGIAGGPAYRGIPFSVNPIKFGTNVYTQQDRNDSWADVKARLYDARYRNFYYHGHGNANTIGCDMHSFDTNNNITGGVFLPNSKAYLSSQNISNEITFNRYGGSRPYRFVWLDGCDTANGNWPGAFGIGKGTNDYASYTNTITNPTHRRPSAFAGWNQPVGTGGVWGSAQGAFNFRSQWMFDWMYNWQTLRLVDAFGQARSEANWPPGGDGQLWGALKVYGYTILRFDELNHKTDWRWP